MSIFHFGVATETNNINQESKEELWIKSPSGELILMEDDENAESN